MNIRIYLSTFSPYFNKLLYHCKRCDLASVNDTWSNLKTSCLELNNNRVCFFPRLRAEITSNMFQNRFVTKTKFKLTNSLTHIDSSFSTKWVSLLNNRWLSVEESIHVLLSSFNLKSLLTFIFSSEHRQTRQPIGFENQENNQLHEPFLHAVSDCGEKFINWEIFS